MAFMETILDGWYSHRTRSGVGAALRLSEIESELAGNEPLVPLDRVVCQMDGADLTYGRYLEIQAAGLKDVLTNTPPPIVYVKRPTNPRHDHMWNASGFSTNVTNALALYDHRDGRTKTEICAEAGCSLQTLYKALKIRRRRKQVEGGKRTAKARWS